MTHADYRRERVKHYEAMLARWRKLVADCPALVDDIRDLERHVNQIRSVTVEREAASAGRARSTPYRVAREPREAGRDQRQSEL